MTKSRYADIDSRSMILRDHLAVERTSMANERTLLAYVRTMIGIIAVGGTILKLFDGWFYFLTGISLIIFGLAILLVGFIRYTRIFMVLQGIYQQGQSHNNQDWMQQTLLLLLQKCHLA